VSDRDTVTAAIVQAVRRHLPFRNYRVFYFGSRASGLATPQSDYDVGIEAGERIPGEVLVKIAWALDDLPILQKIDLVDFRDVSESFSKRAMRTIQVIYEQ
jgi:predicted nucleotidyltransferase